MISNMPIELAIRGERRGKNYYVFWVGIDGEWHRTEEVSASAFYEDLYEIFGLFSLSMKVL